jgi:ubiquinone/menaquinone biosynthesis C-methylase UbiE
MKEKRAVHEAFTELAPRYENVVDEELKTFWGWSFKEYVKKLVELTEISENQKILDIATGTALIPREIFKENIPGIHIAGLDITEYMLRQGKRELANSVFPDIISLTCGDAMSLPFASESFDVIVTGLASHHMNISRFLSEIKRTIKKRGKLTMIDVGISPIWQFPLVRLLSRILAFFYFLLKENYVRALAEAAAVTNLKTRDEWQDSLSELGFNEVKIEELPITRKFLPNPIAITAVN